MSRVNKKARQKKLQETLRDNPFCTDAELAEQFGTSVQTIRLDRAALSIPELRERTKKVAESTIGKVKSLSSEDMVGDLIDLDLNESGISVMETTEDMVFAKVNVVKGHSFVPEPEQSPLLLHHLFDSIQNLNFLKGHESVLEPEQWL